MNDLNDLIIENLKEGLVQFAGNVNWTLIISILIVSITLISNKRRNKISQVNPKLLIAIIGLIITGLFWLTYPEFKRTLVTGLYDFLGIFATILIYMAIMKWKK